MKKKRLNLEFNLNDELEKMVYDKIMSYKKQHATTKKGAVCMLILSQEQAAPVVHQKKSTISSSNTKSEKEELQPANNTHTQPVAIIPENNEPAKTNSSEAPVQPKNETSSKSQVTNNTSINVFDNLDKNNTAENNVSDKEKLRKLLKTPVIME